MASKEELAVMSLEQVRAEKERIMAAKQANADTLLFLETPAGQRRQAEKQAALDRIRDEYRNIDTKQHAELVVRELVITMTREDFARKEIESEKKLRNLSESLDSELEGCNTSINEKEETTRIERS